MYFGMKEFSLVVIAISLAIIASCVGLFTTVWLWSNVLLPIFSSIGNFIISIF